MPADLVYRICCRAGGRGAAAVARLLQQAAGPHAAALGVGMDALRAHGQAWMLARLAMAVRRWPAPGETAEVITWPSRRTAGARAWREFEVVASSGQKLLEAASVWLIVDLRSRRPVRLPRFLHELDFPPRDTEVDFSPVPRRPEAPPRLAHRNVSPEDLDLNLHANNAVYLAWAEMEAQVDAPCRLQVDFLNEALLGEEACVETWEREGGTVIQAITGARGPCVWLQWRRDERS